MTVTATTIAIESVITGIHHLYGAILEADLFRAHMVLVVLFAGLVTALLLRRHLRRTRDGAP